MITSKLIGGLGNQMFIIATTYVLARDNGDDCAFDFSMKPIGQGNISQAYRNNIFKKLKELPPNWKPSSTYKEVGYDYSPIPFQRGMQLSGYFGSEKYFGHRKAEIINLFKEINLLKGIRNMFRGVLNNSVSLHVRRGDYLKFPEVYVLLTADYYNRAIAILDSEVRIDNILVISDDLRWCIRNLKDPRIIFVTGKPDYIDFYLQTLTNYCIMANSSFSWWGSYLNDNEGKIVIAPEIWFKGNNPPNAQHLFLDNWIKL